MPDLTPKSGNRKLYGLPVSRSEPDTCPTTCPFRKKGCYGKYHNSGIHWRNLVKKQLGWKQFLDKVDALLEGTLWRHNEVGDLPGKENRINKTLLGKLVKANNGKRGFTYTHKPVLGKTKLAKRNRALIKQANKNGFVINLSADNLTLADKLSALKIGPVVVVLPKDAPNKLKTPKGRPVISCPNEINKTITCGQCQLCAKVNRKVIVGFHAHGTAAKTVSEIVR